MKCAIFMANGFETCEALVVVDLLRRASLSIDMISMQNDLLVESSHGVKIYANYLFKDINIEDYDALILPGGKQGTINLEANKLLTNAYTKHFKAGKLSAAICAAPSILGHLGLLKGRTFTCFPGFQENGFDGKYTTNLVEEDHNLITGRGMGASVEFALKIISKLAGEEVRKQVEYGIQY